MFRKFILDVRTVWPSTCLHALFPTSEVKVVSQFTETGDHMIIILWFIAGKPLPADPLSKTSRFTSPSARALGQPESGLCLVPLRLV